MIAVDTNVLIRLLVQDDREQHQKARALFESERLFIPLTVILESEWVLRFSYHFKPQEVNSAFHLLLGLEAVEMEHESRVHYALEWYLDGVDFADALHLASSQQCQSLVSFDRSFVNQRIASICPVVHP